jgi:hypothetical protein
LTWVNRTLQRALMRVKARLAANPPAADDAVPMARGAYSMSDISLAVGDGARHELIEDRRRLTDQLDAERGRIDHEHDRADQAERHLADKDATITGLVAEQQVMRQQVETLTELLKARRSWWHRVFGR